MSMVHSIIAVALAALALCSAGPLPNVGNAAGSTCPGSKSWVHAKTELAVTFQNSCASVMSEIKNRVAAGQAGKWIDPHNKGKYTLKTASNTQLALSHLTGNGKYTDELLLTFSGTGSTCSVQACSESQVFSVLDMSTNYCNLHDLYCSDPQCNAAGLPGHTKLTYTEEIKTCSSKQHDVKDCYKSSGLAARSMAGVSVYKIKGAECGQTSLDAKIAPYAEKAAGLKQGTCASQGYTVADGQQTMKIPFVGTTVTILKFKKPSTTTMSASVVATTYVTSFDGSKGSVFTWQNLDDPVMGGASKSTFTAGATGVFNGTCAIVSFLKAPGFAKAVGSPTSGGVSDISRHVNGSFLLRVRSSTPDYKGFKVAFAAKNIPKTSVFGGGSFKAPFELKGTDWQEVKVPFSTFSYDWSGYTGKCDTKDPGFFGRQHYCCSDEHPEVCPTPKFLRAITDVEIWAEGVEGDFHLEVGWLAAADK